MVLSGTSNDRTIELAAHLEDGRLRLSMHRIHGNGRSGDTSDSIAWQANEIQAVSAGILDVLHNTAGQPVSAGSQRLRQYGLELLGLVLPPRIGSALVPKDVPPRGDEAPSLLRIILDPALDFVPWELLYDGHQFLCQYFAIGRIIRTNTPESTDSPCGHSRRLVILSDPQGNLPSARSEGPLIKTAFVLERGWEVTLRNRLTTVGEARALLAQCDVFHFAGHSRLDPNDPAGSGLMMCDGVLTTRDIEQIARAASVPQLVVANSCQSAQAPSTDGTTSSSFVEASCPDNASSLSSLAGAFLRAGARHYIGSLGRPLDEQSTEFGRKLHRLLLDGSTVGEAVFRARMAAIKTVAGTDSSLNWASFVLYGDPAARLVPIESQSSNARTSHTLSAALAAGNAFSPIPCGACGTLVQHDYGIGGECHVEGCNQPICRRCWREKTNQCRVHGPVTVPATALKEQIAAAYSASTILSRTSALTVEESLIIEGFLGRLRQSLARLGTIADARSGKTVKVKSSLIWDSQFLPGTSREDAMLTTLQRDRHVARAVCHALHGYDLIGTEQSKPNCRILALFWQHEYGSDQGCKPSLADIAPLVDEIKTSLEDQGLAYILMLASPVGWDDSLISHVKGQDSPSCRWMHPRVALALHDVRRVVSFFDQGDLRLQPLRGLFDLETFEERVERAHLFATDVLKRQSYVSATQVVAELDVQRECAETAIRLLPGEMKVELRTVDGVGLVAQRVDRTS